MTRTNPEPIRRVAVLGAGVMGGGIAAHLANVGIPSLLLDIVPAGALGADRSKIAREGLEKALKARPAVFFHPSNARLVSVGNLEDDLSQLASVDLVIEAVVERLDIKRSLFERVEKAIGPNTIIASNTSGLRIEEMLEGRSASFKERFLVLHFFNPVRYMKLLEVVTGPNTSPAVLDRAKKLGDVLGKGVVIGKDTPNFIANRIGTHAMMSAIHEMLEVGLAPEDIDNITGTPMGHPKSASFRTADMVGLDTFVHVANNCFNALPNDEEREVFKVPDYIGKMTEKKLLGDKTKSGFYRKAKTGEIETLDPKTLEYRAKGGDKAIATATKSAAKEADAGARVRKLLADEGVAGKFAWKVLARNLAYAARRVGEIADDVSAIDDAMKWGFNWELGPFETWDAIGVADTVTRMKASGFALPPGIEKMQQAGAKSFYVTEASGTKVWSFAKNAYVPLATNPRTVNLSTARARSGSSAVLTTDAAVAWDIGEGVLGVTFTSKANSVEPGVIKMLHDAAERAERDFRALVIFNEGEHFCVGANLFGVLMGAMGKQWDDLRTMVSGYQNAVQRLKYAQVPVVAAPYGMTLGGGLELCFGCTTVQAAAETYSGLVEVGVGLIPGGGGHLNMLWRALENIPEGTTINTYDSVTQVFKNIALAKVATSADEAKHLGFFRHSDGVTLDRARHLWETRARAVGLAEAGHRAPTPRAYRLPGESGIATLGMMVDTLLAGGFASEHDALIARKVAHVLCGGVAGATREVTEEQILELEREAFLSLCGEPKSQERMQHMLQHNKPLRN